MKQPQRSAAEFLPAKRDLVTLSSAVQSCEGCDLYRNATQAVFGGGAPHALVMFVGEQPGDQEDIQGKAFVGPAGRMLDKALVDAGIDRKAVYVTNAVKHFKFEERGKRRLHKRPSVSEVNACRPWLEAEIAAILPRGIVAMGATAARSVVGRDVKLAEARGRFDAHPSAEWMMVTIHPSFLLRIPDAAERHAEYARFVDDLKQIAGRLA